MKLAIVFEETGAYQWKKNKEAERGGSGGGGQGGGEAYQIGLRPGFVEDFTFGDDDPNDYWDRPDITEGRPLND